MTIEKVDHVDISPISSRSFSEIVRKDAWDKVE